MGITKNSRKNDSIYVNDYGLTRWYWIVRHKENLKLGKNTEIGCFTVIGCENGVQIGNNVKIGYNCTIMSDSTIDNKRGQVVLEENCKVGANTVVMPNVRIGKNSVIGANSFVNRSIPPNEIWAGSPVRFIKKIIP